MKTLIKHSLIVAVLFTTLTSYASGVEPLVKVEGKDNKAFTLKMNDLKSQQVKIVIKDNNGIILHTEELNVNTEYFKKYDLTALPTGDYTLEVEDQSIVKVMPFEVTNSDVLFSEENETKVFKPVLRQRGTMVDVMYKTIESKSTRITIYDEEGNLLENKKIAAGQNVETIFDFSNLNNGSYSINFHNGDRVFSQEIAITK